MEYYIIYVLCFILMLYLTEIGAYFWHRSISHSEYKTFIWETHQTHHENVNDLAHLDFLYLFLFIIIYFIVICYLYFTNKINLYIASLLFLPVCITLSYCWYIHTAFHIEDNWLNNYKWFQYDKDLHFIHHNQENKNYGIGTHFADVIFNTYNYC